MPFTNTDTDMTLAEDMAGFYADPLGWVMYAFPWGVPGTDLAAFNGPDLWQQELLVELGEEIAKRGFNGVDPVAPTRFATASGHGVGKSALTAMLILFVMSTRPHSKGVVTANTGDQLRTKTWAELAKWKRMCITGHWFELTARSISHKKFDETWRVDAQTCREENSEAFAGLHAANSTPWYIFDEACHDDKTEVMTDRGWVLFKHANQSDRFLCRRGDGTAYYAHASHMHVSDYDGKLLVREGRGGNFAVTPNHRMLFESVKRPGVNQFAEAGLMSWNNKRIPRTIKWEGIDTPTFTVPAHTSSQKTYASFTVAMDDWCEFMGWYITEGHITRQRKEKGGAVASVVITQKQDTYTDEIEECVKRMGLIYDRRVEGVFIYNPALAACVDEYGKGFDNKRVPQYLKDLSPRQLNIFLDAAVKGDGYVRESNREIIYTSNESLAGDYQEMILKTGVNSVVCRRALEGIRTWIIDHWATASCDGFAVSRAKNNSMLSCDKARPTPQQYKGKVYCATVPGGALFTRRNGVPMWSGNSAVPDKIWDVAEGGLTDGEPFFFAFGNPTRNTGKFSECFTRGHRWITKQIDSRTARMTNKYQIQEWLEDYGEDSDFFRVRVRGVFPRAGDMQFIDGDTVFEAQKRGPGQYLGDDPLIMAVDIARGGDDDCRIGFRRGFDAKSEKSYRIAGEDSRDSMLVVSKLILVLDKHRPDVTFLDATGIGGPIGDRLRQLGYHVIDVHFGGKADDEKRYKNKTAEMGDRFRRWMMAGGSIPNDPMLEYEITSREFQHDDKDRLVLERKEEVKARIGRSPDWADQMYLLFAHPVPKREVPRGVDDRFYEARGTRDSLGYDPLDAMDNMN